VRLKGCNSVICAKLCTITTINAASFAAATELILRLEQENAAIALPLSQLPVQGAIADQIKRKICSIIRLACDS
jgi:hypothetical protein